MFGYYWYIKDYPDQIKEKARKLRREGRTYREIQKALKLIIPKGTLSYWVRNIKMSPDYYKRIRLVINGNIWKAQKVNKQNLEKRLSKLREKNLHLVKSIDKSIGKLLLSVLYWCEGAKYPTHRNIRFGSSDPKMISLFLFLLRSCYLIDESKFRLTIQCRADQKLIFLSHYWKNITRIPYSQHYQPRIDSRSIGKPTQKPFYKGVCVIEHLDCNLVCELQFLSEYLGSDSAIEQMKNQIK